MKPLNSYFLLAGLMASFDTNISSYVKGFKYRLYTDI